MKFKNTSLPQKTLFQTLFSPISLLILAAVWPLLETTLLHGHTVSKSMHTVFIFALLGLGLHIITGCTGILNLGVSAFMAIGAYSYAITTCNIYPFQLGFWTALLVALVSGAAFGFILGLPTIRLRGDYLAIVTLGFGEIVQDLLRNLDLITKGTQGINPLPGASWLGSEINRSSTLPWYYLLLSILSIVVLLLRNLEASHTGRMWFAIREDELAARSVGINPVKGKLLAFLVAAALCSLAGALWVALLGTSGEPGNYDFQISVTALCIIIVGGLGNISGVLLGSLIITLVNNTGLTALTEFLGEFLGSSSSSSVISSPQNWKYLIIGLILVLMMRFRPNGILPDERGAKANG